MGRSRRGKSVPSSPEQILQRQAELRAAARAAAKDPAQWGVSAQIIQLPTSADVTVVRGAREAVIAANRSDPFDLLLQAGSLSEDQHRAARRLFRDWCLRAGVRDRERLALERVDGGRPDPSALVSDAMIDAGGRIADALRGVGPVNAQLLTALISPIVDEGRVGPWRWWVEKVTGIKNRDAQGPLVIMACEALRLVYQEGDRERRFMRDAAIPMRKPGRRHAGGGSAA